MHKSIKQRHKRARIEKNKELVAVLANLLGDLNAKAKEKKVSVISDREVIEIINTWIKRTKHNIKLYADKPQASLEAHRELDVYSSLLPKPLCEDEIRKIIAEHNLDSVPKVMQHFSQNYLGRYTSKDVLKIFNSAE